MKCLLGPVQTSVLSAVTGTSFCYSKKSFNTLYKQYVRPIMQYACLVWTPGLALRPAIHLQVYLTGTPEQAHLTGRPDSVWRENWQAIRPTCQFSRHTLSCLPVRCACSGVPVRCACSGVPVRYTCRCMAGLMHHNTLQRTQNAAFALPQDACRVFQTSICTMTAKCYLWDSTWTWGTLSYWQKLKVQSISAIPLLSLRETARGVRTTPAVYLRVCLEPVPPCPETSLCHLHIHNTHASRATEETIADTILGYPHPQVDKLSLHIHNTHASRATEETIADTILGYPHPQVDKSYIIH